MLVLLKSNPRVHFFLRKVVPEHHLVLLRAPRAPCLCLVWVHIACYGSHFHFHARNVFPFCVLLFVLLCACTVPLSWPSDSHRYDPPPLSVRLPCSAKKCGQKNDGEMGSPCQAIM